MYRNPLNLTFTLLVCLFILLPVIFVIRLAFTGSEYLRLDGYTLKWLNQLFLSRAWMEAVWKSILIGLITAVFSVILSVILNESIRIQKEARQRIMIATLVTPSAFPLIIVSIALLRLYYKIGMTDTVSGLVFAHLVLAVPVSFLLIYNYSRGFFKLHPNVENAALLCGAGYLQTFFFVVFPGIRYAVIQAFFVSFLISFNEGVLVQLLSGRHTLTIGKKLYDGLRFEISPVVAAFSLVLIVTTIAGSIFVRKIRKTDDAKSKL